MILEEKLHLRKSKPVLLAVGLIWVVIAFFYQNMGDAYSVEAGIRHNFLEYSELFFFLLVAMTYINAMLERGVFDALRDWLVNQGFGYRSLFWITGILGFYLPLLTSSPPRLLYVQWCCPSVKHKRNLLPLAALTLLLLPMPAAHLAPLETSLH
ncbi:MAG: hypothetical protein ACI965_001935 [Paraglaciecola sp.]